MNIEVIRPASRLNSTANIKITAIGYVKEKLYVGFANGDLGVFDVDITFIPEQRKPQLIRSFKSLNDIRTYFSETKSSNFTHDITFPNINGDSSAINRIDIISINQSTNRTIFAIVNNDVIKIFEKVGSHLNLVQTIEDSKYFQELYFYEMNEKKYLAVGIKKKLVILQMVYKTRNIFHFQKIHESSLKERIKAINSINLDHGIQLIIGLNNDFILIDINNNYSTTSIFTEDNELIQNFNNTSFSYFGLTSSGPSIWIIKINEEDYCLIKDTQCVLISYKELKFTVSPCNIKLPTSPIFVGLISPSYLFIMYTKKVEIVEIDSGDLIQKISHLINSSTVPTFLNESFVFLGAINDLLQFNICSYQQQIDQYLKFGVNDNRPKKDPSTDLTLIGLNKAISFIEKLDEEDEYFGGTRVSKEKRKQLFLRDLYKTKAILIFERYSKYHESLVEICSEWLISYKDVLDLFPEFLSINYYLNDRIDPELLKQSKNFMKRIKVEDIEQLKYSTITTADSATEVEEQSKAPTYRVLPTNIFGQTKDQNLKKFNKAVNNLIVYLTDQRRIHLNFSHEEAYKWKGINVTPFDLYDFVTPETYKYSLEQISKEIDTSLFLCYFHCKPMLLGPLLRLPNNKCDSTIVNQCLLSNVHNHHFNEPNFIKELLDFYFGRNLHHEALEMLHKLSHEEVNHDDDFDDFLRSPSLTIQYLQKLDNSNLPLVLQYSTWLLTEKDQNIIENARLIFMNDTYECESYDNMEVLDFFKNDIRNEELAIQYLEWIIFESDLSENPTKIPVMGQFHTKLCVSYLSLLKKQKDASQFEKLPTYSKLMEFLKSTDLYEPWAVLKHIPTDNVNFLRFTIFIYKRLGEHDKSIDVLYNQLDDLDGAIDYCAEIYDYHNQSQGTTLLHKLLEDLLMHYNENIGNIEKLLILQGSKMETLKVLTILPNSFPVNKLSQYLNESVRNSKQQLVNTRLSSQLYKVGSIKLQHELLTTQSKGYLIESSKKLCSICNKRLGYSVFTVHDNNKIVHYACQQRLKSNT